MIYNLQRKIKLRSADTLKIWEKTKKRYLEENKKIKKKIKNATNNIKILKSN